jgi:hypothetical protein
MRWKVTAAFVPLALMVSLAAFAGDLSRARSLVEAGRPMDALANLDDQLAKNPVDPEAMFLRGLVLAEIQRESEARAVFEKLRSLRPDRPEPLNNLAVIQAAAGDYDGAVETLKEALRTHPAYRTVYENLTRIYGQLASEAYSRALSVEGTHDRSSVELVLLSEMQLPDSQPVLVAQTPLEPLPSGATADAGAGAPAVEASRPALPIDTDESVGAAEDAEPPADEAPVVAQTPSTPDEAIEQALRQGRDVEGGSGETAATEPQAVPDVANPADLAAVVEAWARAWAQQRVDDYLSFYSDAFVPANGASLDEWREVRRRRVAAPEFVKVSVAFLDFEIASTDRALVRFNQSYESDTFSDVVTKTLELVRESGAWKIVAESVES